MSLANIDYYFAGPNLKSGEPGEQLEFSKKSVDFFWLFSQYKFKVNWNLTEVSGKVPIMDILYFETPRAARFN